MEMDDSVMLVLETPEMFDRLYTVLFSHQKMLFRMWQNLFFAQAMLGFAC